MVRLGLEGSLRGLSARMVRFLFRAIGGVVDPEALRRGVCAQLQLSRDCAALPQGACTHLKLHCIALPR